MKANDNQGSMPVWIVTPVKHPQHIPGVRPVFATICYVAEVDAQSASHQPTTSEHDTHRPPTYLASVALPAGIRSAIGGDSGQGRLTYEGRLQPGFDAGLDRDAGQTSTTQQC